MIRTWRERPFGKADGAHPRSSSDNPSSPPPNPPPSRGRALASIAHRAGLIAATVAALAGCASPGQSTPLITVSREDLEVDASAYAAFIADAIAAASPAPSDLSIPAVRAYMEANSGTGLVFRLGERNRTLAEYRSVIALNPNALSEATVKDHIDHLFTPPLWQVLAVSCR